MTVIELIEKLRDFDEDLEVRYEDFENGPEVVETVQLASRRDKKLGIKFDGDEYVSLSQ